MKVLYLSCIISLLLLHKGIGQSIAFLDRLEARALQSNNSVQQGLDLTILAIEHSTLNAAQSNAYLDLLNQTIFSQQQPAFPACLQIIEAYQKLNQEIKVPLETLEEVFQSFEQNELFSLCGYTRLLEAHYNYLDRRIGPMERNIQSCITYFDQANYPKGIADCNHILGMSSRSRKQYETATAHFRQAIKNYNRINSRVELQALLNLASTFQSSDRLDSAVYYYRQVAPKIAEGNYPTLQAFLYSNWSNIMAEQGDSLKADSLRDLVALLSQQYAEENYEDFAFPSFFKLGNNKRSNQKIQQTVATWQEEKNKLLLRQLEMENQLKQSKLKVQRLALISTLLIGLLLTYIVITLNKKNQKIHKQNQEKDTLLREIHHRVKNNLQIISSLLSLQTQKTEDSTAVLALKEGQSRVQSMSIIHQDLYQHDNLTAIDIQAYLKKLVKNLAETYHIADTFIEIHQNVDPIQLDVESVVPLGLIINELITNAIKYAFPDKNGQIDIELTNKSDHLFLCVKDNGIGFQEDQPIEGFGYDMIHAFSDRLEADVEIKQDAGTQVSFKIKNYQIYTKS